ncbi:hypothetical protein ABPG72_019735 [Tetrahymena utriculariae]
MIPDLKQTLAKIMRHSIQEKSNHLNPQQIENEFKMLSDQIVKTYFDIYDGNIDEQSHMFDQRKYGDIYQHKPLISLKQLHSNPATLEDKYYKIYMLIMKYHFFSNFGQYFYINKKKIESSIINQELQQEALQINCPFKIPLIQGKFIK